MSGVNTNYSAMTSDQMNASGDTYADTAKAYEASGNFSAAAEAWQQDAESHGAAAQQSEANGNYGDAQASNGAASTMENYASQDWQRASATAGVNPNALSVDGQSITADQASTYANQTGDMQNSYWSSQQQDTSRMTNPSHQDYASRM